MRVKKEKPLSAARAREFRGRYLRKHFGDLKSRAERFARLWRVYGHAQAIQLSRMNSFGQRPFGERNAR